MKTNQGVVTIGIKYEENIRHHYSSIFSYLHQVINETLRCAVVAPWAARFSDTDSELGGHTIPAKVTRTILRNSLCLPPTGSGDILFFPVRLSVCPSQIVSAL